MENNSKLLITGDWFNRKGILACKISDIKFLKSIDEIVPPDNLAFIIIPYHQAEETLGINVKKEEDKNIIYANVESITPFKYVYGKSYTLKPIKFIDDEISFSKKVNYIKEEIEKGTVYQVNLTTRIDFEFYGCIYSLFHNYMKRQPVPFGFLLKTKDLSIMSGSMELFLKKKGFRIISSPIKGTSKNRSFLENSHKDRAENLMITDMVRNDLGRIGVPGSVKVKELFKIVRYKTLHHMHSTVEAITQESFNSIIKATFPPASVTGAPKKKAVELIDNIEDFPRLYYCGCAGFIDGKGNFTLSVLIRTCMIAGDKLCYYTGCGIVWDSDPKKEFEELILKVKALYDFSFYS